MVAGMTAKKKRHGFWIIHVSFFTRTTSQSPRLRETLATVAITSKTRETCFDSLVWGEKLVLTRILSYTSYHLWHSITKNCQFQKNTTLLRFPYCWFCNIAYFENICYYLHTTQTHLKRNDAHESLIRATELCVICF